MSASHCRSRKAHNNMTHGLVCCRRWQVTGTLCKATAIHLCYLSNADSTRTYFMFAYQQSIERSRLIRASTCEISYHNYLETCRLLCTICDIRVLCTVRYRTDSSRRCDVLSIQSSRLDMPYEIWRCNSPKARCIQDEYQHSAENQYSRRSGNC